jgi:hypothetical protein
MSAAVISPNFYSKKSTEELIRARDLVEDILDFRARQTSLFEVPAPAETKVDAPAVVLPAGFTQTEVSEVLSPSSVNLFGDCETKWLYRKVLQLHEDRSAALGLGGAVHIAVGANFRQKIETGEDMPFESVRTIFRDEMERELDAIVLQKGESAEDLRDAGEAMVRVYMTEAAPSIMPAAIEVPVRGMIGQVEVRGFIDLLDVNGDIIDFKTAKKKPGCFPANHLNQVTTYAMLEPRASGVARLDTLTKTKRVDLDSRTVTISAADRKHTEKLYAITLDQMKTGLVKPNRSSFLCSRKYCGFANQCEADYGGKVD